MVAEHETTTTWPLPFSERPELDLKADFGAIWVEPVAAGEQPRLVATGSDPECLDVRVTTRGEVVAVRLRRINGFRLPWGSRDVHVTAFVPRDLRARLHTDAGRLDIRGLGPCSLAVSADAGNVTLRDLGPCDLEVRTDAGQIHLRDIRGRVKVSSDAGQVRGSGLAGSLDVETDAGRVDLAIDALDPGEHRIRTDVGSIRVELAPGIDVRVETRASIGSARNEYPSRAGAPTVLRTSTDVGSIRVRSRGPDVGHAASGDERAWHVVIPPMPHVWPVGHNDEVDEDDDKGGAQESRPSSTGARRVPDSEVERILKLVEAGQLSAKDADELLRALGRD